MALCSLEGDDCHGLFITQEPSQIVPLVLKFDDASVMDVDEGDIVKMVKFKGTSILIFWMWKTLIYLHLK